MFKKLNTISLSLVLIYVLLIFLITIKYYYCILNKYTSNNSLYNVKIEDTSAHSKIVIYLNSELNIDSYVLYIENLVSYNSNIDNVVSIWLEDSKKYISQFIDIFNNHR